MNHDIVYIGSLSLRMKFAGQSECTAVEVSMFAYEESQLREGL